MLKKHLKIQQRKQIVVWDGRYDNTCYLPALKWYKFRSSRYLFVPSDLVPSNTHKQGCNVVKTSYS